MGLRPSVKSEGNNHGSSSFNKSAPSSMIPAATSNASTQEEGNVSASASPSSSQREAWTARGQLLLNFHHAISRAINSPEMMRKCSQIAEDMARSEEKEASHPFVNHANSTSNTNSSSVATTTNTNNGRLLKSSSSSSHFMAEEYSAEAALIVENKSKRDATVRNKSLAVGLLAFVTLRSGRALSSFLRKSIIAAAKRSGKYSFDAMPVGSSLGKHHVKHRGRNSSTASSTSTTTTMTAFAKQHPPPSTLRTILHLTLDTSVSTTLALLSGTFLFMPRPSAYIEDMAQLPLVEGKSVYAEMVCPPLLKEYRRVLEQYGGRWPVMGNTTSDDDDGGGGGGGGVKTEKGQLTQEDVSLNVIRTFVENCSKRSKYERALLEERNALASSFDNDNQESTVSRLMNRITRGDDDTDTDSNSSSERSDYYDTTKHDVTKIGTVPIPSPGVPESISVNVDQDVFTLVDAAPDYDEDVK